MFSFIICESQSSVHLSTFNFEANKAWKSAGVIKRVSSISASINRDLTKGGWPASSITICAQERRRSLHCTPISLFLAPSHTQSRLSNCRLEGDLRNF